MFELPLLGLQCSHEFERSCCCCFRHASPLYIFVRLSTCSGPFLIFFALCFCRHTQPHNHKMHIAVDMNASFAVHAGSCVWRLLSSSVCVTATGDDNSDNSRPPSPELGKRDPTKICLVHYSHMVGRPVGHRQRVGETARRV
ncbi:mucin TcMUCII [Trypanosoma cruzi]|nr:mucin TcMUCII [Trypanosoma cruzi]